VAPVEGATANYKEGNKQDWFEAVYDTYNKPMEQFREQSVVGKSRATGF